MKWAKTKSECDKIRKALMNLGFIRKVLMKLGFGAITDKSFTSIDKEMSYYHQIPDKTCLENYLTENKFGKWLEVADLPRRYTRASARARYELFIGGYLYYFDNEVKESGSDNRILYFDWGKINSKATLTIFLKPFYNNPLETAMIIKNSDINSNGNGNGNGEHNGFINEQEVFDVLKNKQGGKMQKTLVASPPAIEGTDPPPPPPPPPPPRE